MLIIYVVVSAADASLSPMGWVAVLQGVEHNSTNLLVDILMAQVRVKLILSVGI